MLHDKIKENWKLIVKCLGVVNLDAAIYKVDVVQSTDWLDVITIRVEDDTSF